MKYHAMYHAITTYQGSGNFGRVLKEFASEAQADKWWAYMCENHDDFIKTNGIMVISDQDLDRLKNTN